METCLSIGHRPCIAVIGDIMLDKSRLGSVTKIANEAPIPVFQCSKEKARLGGSGNVAANLAAFGCDALYLFGRVGQDSAAETVRELCAEAGISDRLIYNGMTTVKNRYYCGNTLLFRHDEEVNTALSSEQSDRLLEELWACGPLDCIVLSDYNKGLLTKELCQRIINGANERGIVTVVDPKADATKYIGCTVIKPNLVECRTLFAVNGREGAAAHEKIRVFCKCKASVITLSENGMSYGSDDTFIHRANQKMEVIDVTGAGDIVCSTIAYLYPLGVEARKLLDIANFFAMRSVGHLGSYTLQTGDFIACRAAMKNNKVVSWKEAAVQGQVVFTNGCFDICHVGHLDLLKRCRDMGSVVIVGLNSDASIRRLKGPSRPIQSVDDYDHDVVMDNEGDRQWSKAQINEMTAAYPFAWPQLPPSATTFQKKQEDYMASLSSKLLPDLSQYKAIEGFQVLPPDTEKQEEEEQKLLKTYVPACSKDLKYDVDDAMDLINKIYDQKGLIAKVDVRPDGVYEVYETKEKNPKIEYDDGGQGLLE